MDGPTALFPSLPGSRVVKSAGYSSFFFSKIPLFEPPTTVNLARELRLYMDGVEPRHPCGFSLPAHHKKIVKHINNVIRSERRRESKKRRYGRRTVGMKCYQPLEWYSQVLSTVQFSSLDVPRTGGGPPVARPALVRFAMDCAFLLRRRKALAV